MRTTIAQTLTFGHAGNAMEALLFGWYNPEPEHIWSVGERSALWLDSIAAPFGYYLEFDWFPSADPPRVMGQVVTVRVNGRNIRSFEVRHGGLTAVLCPPPEHEDRRICVEFEHQGAITANELFGYPDSRELAIGFRRLRVLVLREPPDLRRGRQGGAILAEPDVAAATREAERRTGMSIQEIVSNFEMIAGNCDVGLVQRALGVEPLGLLRFAGATDRVAVRGLDTDFAGIGEDIVARPRPDGNEWMVHDSYGLRYHTGRHPNDVTQEEIIRQERRKVAFLRRKLLEDVEEGAKFFVVHEKECLPLDNILPLFLALNRNGPRRLLWITLTFDPRRFGVVEEIIPNLFQGTIDLFSPPFVGHHISIGGILAVFCGAIMLSRQAASEPTTD